MMLHDVGRFSRDGDQLTAEASTLGWTPGTVPDAFRVRFPDGSVREFDFVGTDHNGDEDAGWNYREVEPDGTPLPLRALVIND